MGLNSFDSDEVYGKFEEDGEDSEEKEYERLMGCSYDNSTLAKRPRAIEEDEDGEARQWAMFERMHQEDLKRYRLSQAVRTDNPTAKEYGKIIGMAPRSLRQADKVARGEVKPADKHISLEKIMELRKEGLTYKKIGDRLGVCESTIKKKMRKIKEQAEQAKQARPEGKVFMIFEGRWK